MKQRTLSALLAAALCLGIIGVAGFSFQADAASFSDVTDADTAEAVSVLSSLGIVSGYSDGTYHPSATLTRAQFCTLAVLAEGHGDQVQGSAYRTLFSDLPATHWAAPYVNLAQSEGLISGYGNGRFGPDDAVTVGQAVTIVLRLMGYTEEDVGALWPQDYMQKATDLGLLDGISTNSSAAMTRGEAALLLYAMLKSDTKDGSDYVAKLASSTISSAVLLSNDDEAADGTLHTAQVYAAQGGLTWYEQSTDLPDTLVGRRGTLLLDKSGKVCGFLPDDTTVRTLQLDSADAGKLVAQDGASYTISNSTALLMDDELTTYGSAWYELEGRSTVTLYYTASGSIDLVVASEAVKYDGVALTGYYEAVSPNTTNPDTITLLGLTLEVSDEAISSLSAFKVGDKLTVVLNGAGEVAYACSTSERTAQMVGLVTAAGDTCSVELFNGLTVSGERSGSSVSVGDLVRVTSSGIGNLSLSTATGGVSGSLNVAKGTLGSVPLADNVVLYDRVGKSSAVRVELDDILTDTVSASKITYAGTNADGEVDVVVLNNVTGDAYTYGILHTGTKTEGSGDMQVTNDTVAVENSAGTTQDYLTGSSVRSQSVGGVAATSDGKTAGVVTLDKVTGVARSAFDGEDAVVLDGVRVPVSDDVQVYNADSGQWITLGEAKAYTDTFTVYYSGTIGSDAKVRVIFTE
ncbi:hypothetical protein B5G43_02410 [Flavonifractor sp. An92]|uniref:S-layer homology domain-containing protein n=1 Tax=Flavonifractor sp. An92 TaxID=1965666 RepID=UPI000B36C25C|nr:S-layer homology domain-containing protein [Flavonifractor sp. An92]OUN08254.1 hypothetical protein B5G43_02410 [Flavonifractor sp. An92]